MPTLDIQQKGSVMTESKDMAKSTRTGPGQWLTKPVQLPLSFYWVMFTVSAIELLRVLRVNSPAEIAITLGIVLGGSLILVLIVQRLRRRHPKAVRLEDKETEAATSDSRSFRESYPRRLRIVRWPRIVAILYVAMTVIAAGDLILKVTT